MTDADHIIGYCPGSCGEPCGRPLASARHYQRLGVFEHRGGGKCRSCTTKHQRRQQLLAVPAELIASVDLSWQTGAACVGADPGLFTTDLTGNSIPEETVAAAFRFCSGCRIKGRCGAEADQHEDIGLRAGVFRVLKPRVAAGETSRYKRYDVLAGEHPYKPRTARDAA